MAEIVLCSLIIQAGMPEPRTKLLLFQVSERYKATFFVLILKSAERFRQDCVAVSTHNGSAESQSNPSSKGDL